MPAVAAVSYTHLDVYKRQGHRSTPCANQEAAVHWPPPADAHSGRTFPDRAEKVLSKTAASFQSMGQLLFPCLLYTSRCV